MTDNLIVKATFFGKTKMVRADPHNMSTSETPEEILWVERGEDMYALMSPQLKNKKVAVVRREDWIMAKII